MFAPTMTALALIFTLAPQATIALRAAPSLLPVAAGPAAAPGAAAELPERVSERVAERVAETASVAAPLEIPAPEPEAVPALIPVAEPAVRLDERPATGDALDEAARTRILAEVKTALASARTAKGDFTQINGDGSVMTGNFALRRPGRMRFDYDAPTPILIVADGTTVAMEDSELETVDRIPLSATPLGLILDDKPGFGDDVEILRVSRGSGKVAVTLRDATGEVDGELTMILAEGSYDLLGWTTLDSNLQVTSVELSNVQTNVAVNPKLFILRDQQDEEEER